ncbi:hypothetical protein RND81_12G147900 [Saponaria officinalis]|uniref:Rapid ALkalinization Factor n=1 Tax=Saponaria officinalis TaxID=3572 RepID=A0AAW1HAU5_SAPOF
MANLKAVILLISVICFFGITIVHAQVSYDPLSPLLASRVGDEWNELEFELDSMSNRRILAQSNYISYGALNKNKVPCSRRGASYYNCQPGAQANPYRRGCSNMSRCSRS